MKRRIRLILLFLISVILFNVTSCAKEGYSYTDEGLIYTSNYSLLDPAFQSSYVIKALKEETIFDIDSVNLNVWLGLWENKQNYDNLRNGEKMNNPYGEDDEVTLIGIGFYLFFNNEILYSYVDTDDYKNIDHVYLLKEYEWDYIYNKERLIIVDRQKPYFGSTVTYQYGEMIHIPSDIFKDKKYRKNSVDDDTISIHMRLINILQDKNTKKYVVDFWDNYKYTGEIVTFRILDNNKVERI